MKTGMVMVGTGSISKRLRRSRAAGLVTVLALIAPSALGAAHPAGALPSSWTPRDPLTAFDGVGGDEFGLHLVVSGFGTTAIVGAPEKTVGGNDQAGAAYVYVNNAGTWQFQAELNATDAAKGDELGSSVAITKDGSTVVVGAPFKTVAGKTMAGPAYVFTRSGTTWTQSAELTPTRSGNSNAFGAVVAINGIATRIAVSAPLRSVAGHKLAGAVTVFSRVGTAWHNTAFLTAPDGLAGDRFGWALVAKETQILVSTPVHVNANGSTGAVYDYDEPGGTYALQTVLTAKDGKHYDAFGTSLSLSSATLVVGAPAHMSPGPHRGAVYVFTHSDSTGVWRQRAEIVPADSTAADDFGTTVAISGGTIAAGDGFHQVGSNANQGAVYVFTGAAATWAQQAELTAADAGEFTRFGDVSVGVSDTTVMVGEPDHAVGGASNVGLVDVFQNS